MEGDIKMRFLRHHWVAAVLIVSFITLELFLLGLPAAPIYDEIVYVKVAYNMFNLTPQPAHPHILGGELMLESPLNLTHYYPKQPLGKDFNTEQMPLGKIIMGVFVYVFAPNQVDYLWARVPSVIMSAIALVSMYGIGLEVLREKRYALLAMAFLNFDTLFWIQSRAALLDIYFLAFMMLGIWLWLRGHRNWSMVFMALSVLSKLAGISGLIIVFAYELYLHHKRSELWQTFKRFMICGGIFFAVAAPLYTIYCYIWGMSQNPITNLLLYPEWLRHVDWTFSLVTGGSGSAQPWGWLLNQHPLEYLRVFDPATGYPLVNFIGQMNPVLIMLGVPLVVNAGYQMFKKNSSLHALGFIWFMAAWLPYLFYTLEAQEQFIHHSLGFLPAVILLVSAWLRDQTKAFKVGYSVFVGFAWIFTYPYGLLWLYVVGWWLFPLCNLSFLYGC